MVLNFENGGLINVRCLDVSYEEIIPVKWRLVDRSGSDQKTKPTQSMAIQRKRGKDPGYGWIQNERLG